MFRVMSVSIIITIYSLTASFVFGQSTRAVAEETLDKILETSRYDPRIRPFDMGNGSEANPTEVNVNIFFRSIEYVCAKKSEWKVQITFRQQWKDSRLEFEDKNGQIRYLTLDDVKRIWRPDVFFTNSKSSQSHSELMPNNLIRIYPNGTVLYSTRLTLTLACPMDLKHFPFDEQTCSVKLASYGRTTDDLTFAWKEEDPIQVTKSLNLRELTLESFSTGYCDSTTVTGNYSCLRVNFKFDRESSRYVTNWILPTAIITFVSFASFWLRRDKSARIITLAVTLLLLYLHTVLISYKLPSVSYSTAIDCWTSTCLLFILGAILEYGVVKGLDRCKKCNSKETDSNNDCKKNNTNNCEEGDAVAMKPLVEDGHENHVNEEGKEYTVNEVSNRRNYVQKWRRAPIGCRIDAIAGIVFPLLFILYAITFFCYELMRKEDMDA